MNDWRTTVRSEAEQVVEHFGISAHNVEAVETLATDELFQELAVARHSAGLAHDVTVGIDADDSEEMMDEDVHEAADDLLRLLRDRGATLLLAEAFDPEPTEARSR